MHVDCRRPNVAHPIENDELDAIHDGRERERDRYHLLEHRFSCVASALKSENCVLPLSFRTSWLEWVGTGDREREDKHHSVFIYLFILHPFLVEQNALSTRLRLSVCERSGKLFIVLRNKTYAWMLFMRSEQQTKSFWTLNSEQWTEHAEHADACFQYQCFGILKWMCIVANRKKARIFFTDSIDSIVRFFCISHSFYFITRQHKSSPVAWHSLPQFCDMTSHFNIA